MRIYYGKEIAIMNDLNPFILMDHGMVAPGRGVGMLLKITEHNQHALPDYPAMAGIIRKYQIGPDKTSKTTALLVRRKNNIKKCK